MKPMDVFIYLSLKREVSKATTTVLSSYPPPEKKVNEAIWRMYKKGCRNLEKQETIGASIMVRLAFLTHILYKVLCINGFNKNESINLTAQITWMIYKKLTTPFWKVTGILTRRPISRVRILMKFHIKCFPYRGPGYEMEIMPSPKNEFRFNVYKCPVAEYFKKRNLSKLCLESWCDLDYKLADLWGVKLERTKTLAAGDDLCNFVFKEL